jgi:hypothetical protein
MKTHPNLQYADAIPRGRTVVAHNRSAPHHEVMPCT